MSDAAWPGQLGDVVPLCTFLQSPPAPRWPARCDSESGSGGESPRASALRAAFRSSTPGIGDFQEVAVLARGGFSSRVAVVELRASAPSPRDAAGSQLQLAREQYALKTVRARAASRAGGGLAGF
jgi:hypothetical protein